ncbi:MAG: phenylalanine--tRNA ligase subunit alpha [Caldisericia bacterium]|nr:phenylalanine--tRNA ligase subunit alpha [Caldisericia bacterium]
MDDVHKTNAIKELKKEFETLTEGIHNKDELERLKVKFLGRKGEIRSLFGKMKDVAIEQKKEFGAGINDLKGFVERRLQSLLDSFSVGSSEKDNKNYCDLTLPGINFSIGHQHPVTQVIDDLLEIFRSLNFDVLGGMEIEDTFHNFDALNIHKWHPSRNAQDTFYLDPEHILRTQTSAMQIRAMESGKLPLRIITMGRCYRRDASDATHYPVFHQIEGLVVDKNVNFCDLSGILTEMMTGVFGKRVEVRFQPSYFPFVEPGAETFISCPFCNQKGCSICQNTGVIELGGSGMVHPQVLRNVGIDPKVYRGFAFGWGIERIAMLKYQINDIRLFYENNINFLEQF